MKVILHCSDSKYGNVAEITKWHTLPKPNGRGWSNIGYHYVILNGQLSVKANNKNFDGHIETGRPIDDDNMIEPFEKGAHTRGHNDSIGICLIGMSGVFTAAQIMGLYKILNVLEMQFGTIEISQHSDYEPKKPFCAGLDTDGITNRNNA